MKKLSFWIALFGLLWIATPLHADDVTINTTYPYRYGEYEHLSAANDLTVGGGSLNDASATLFGDLTVTDGSLTIRGNRPVRLGIHRGPFAPCGEGCDGLYLDPVRRFILIGGDIYNPLGLRLKVLPRIKARAFYASGWDTVNNKWLYTYQEAEGNTDTVSDTTKKAYFGARHSFGAQADLSQDFSDDTYAPLRIEGGNAENTDYPQSIRGVYLGLEDPVAGLGGSVVQSVNIGTTTTYTDTLSGKENPALLNINGRALTNVGGWTTFTCSRAFKQDIDPLTSADYARVLAELPATEVARFRYKSEKASAARTLGVIAEHSPKEILSQGESALDLARACGYIAAAIKALKAENDALRQRLAHLEVIKAARKAGTP